MIFTRFTDRAADERGTLIYETCCSTGSYRGRIREHTSYEDTQRTLGFDQRLGIAPPPAGAATAVMADGQ